VETKACGALPEQPDVRRRVVRALAIPHRAATAPGSAASSSRCPALGEEKVPGTATQSMLARRAAAAAEEEEEEEEEASSSAASAAEEIISTSEKPPPRRVIRPTPTMIARVSSITSSVRALHTRT
jgi:hypothetical protein